MSTVLVSTGALIGRPNGRDYRLIEKFAKELSCDGYEFMMYSDWYDKIDDIVKFLKDNNISTPTYHCQKSIGEAISKGGEENFNDAFSRFGQNAEMAAKMGVKKLVLHLWDGITSDQHFDNNLRAYKELRRISDSFGLVLCVENVVCNKDNPMLHWKQLLDEYKDISFVFDTKMAAFHNQMSELYAPYNDVLHKENHICHYHVNDYAGGYMDWANLRTLPIGKGNIDFEEFFRFIKKTGYNDTFTIESTAFDSSGAVDMDMLNREIEFIKSHIS